MSTDLTPLWWDELNKLSIAMRNAGSRLKSIDIAGTYMGGSFATAGGIVKVNDEVPKPREQLRVCECIKCPVCSGYIQK